MTDTQLSNAVVFPEDRGTGLGGGDSDYSSAGHFGLLSQHQGGTYVGNGLGFTNVDTTNETVDITTGHAFIEVSSVTVQSGSGETYDTTLPDPIVMTIALPSTVTLSLDTDAVNDVYLATDPATNDGTYLRHGSAVTEPTDPSVLLGTVNTSDGSTTRASDNASPTFDTVTSNSVNTDELIGDWDSLVTTDDDLVSVLSTASDDEIIQLSGGEHIISDWLDIDGVSGTVIRGTDSTIIKVADGSDVGGFRLGSSAAVSDVTIKDIHFNGNAANQDQSIKRLHAYICDDADGCEFVRCSGTRTSPHHDYLGDDAHNSGGSIFTCRSNATDITYRECVSVDTGDRAMQLAGSGHDVVEFATYDGFDRSISLDVQLPDGSWDGADDVLIRDSLLGDNSDGSCIATREYGASGITIRDCTFRGTFRGAVQADNSNCANWMIDDPDVMHTGADLSQNGFILEDDSQLIGGQIIEDSQTGWYKPVQIRGDDVRVDTTIKILSSNQSESVVEIGLNTDPLNARVSGVIFCGPHASGVNNYAGIGADIRDVTVHGFGDGDGIGAAVRANGKRCHVSNVTGIDANNPRAFIAWDDASGVCHGNYDRSSATTHYDFASSPDLAADNYPTSP